MSSLFREDLALAQQVAQGDSQAQERLVRRLLLRHRNLCRILLSDAQDADDASQEGLLEVLRSAASYRGVSKLETWADRIVVRAALRVAREHRRRTSMLAELTPQPLPSLETKNITRDQLRRLLEHLPEERRQVLVLRHVLDYSIDDIAILTNVSRNTVKDRLGRAREQLRALLRRPATRGLRARCAEGKS